MDNDTLKRSINIDPQKDFTAAVVDDGLSQNKIKDYLKDFDFKKIMKDTPLKTLRHDQSLQNTKVILGSYDHSGSMSNTLAHEMPHISSKKSYEEFELFNKETFEKGKIIVFDEIEKAGAAKDSFKDVFNMLSGMLDTIRTSRERGEELAESFQQGATAPVAVRRPVSFRPRATA